MYSAQRLPDCIVDVTDIVLGQSARGFRRAGYSGMETWQVVSAPGRRRRWRYDGKSTLAATIASASDLDDLIPSIVAYQIEWNKMHGIVADDPTCARSWRAPRRVRSLMRRRSRRSASGCGCNQRIGSGCGASGEPLCGGTSSSWHRAASATRCR